MGIVHRVYDKNLVDNITARDGGKCCITGLGNSLDPLIVVQIFPTIEGQLDPVSMPHATARFRIVATSINTSFQGLHEMLGAFLSPVLRDWALTANSANNPQNLRLVRKSAATAFSQVFFRIQPKGNKTGVGFVAH